jgi:hypothetical protein
LSHHLFSGALAGLAALLTALGSAGPVGAHQVAASGTDRQVSTVERAAAAPTGPALAEAAPVNPSNHVSLEGGGLDLPVGVYDDCTRASEVGHDGAYVDACIPRPLAYFIGHNPGPFTPMAGVGVGQVVDYYDGAGHLHRLQVVSARTWNRFWGAPPLSQADVVAQFQTCLTLDAVWDRILDAVELPDPPAPPPVVPLLAEYRSASSV